MEQTGLPNAGIYDQRAALQWIQDYIGLVGGDKSQVSAWGESAGAGSILHHLTAFGGTQDPLFSKAVMQSPAFQLMFDRKGTLEDTFQNFTALAGCAGKGVECLRAAPAAMLQSANTALNIAGPPGGFAVGPAADGKWIRQLGVLEYASGASRSLPSAETEPLICTLGNYWKGIDSVILSHVLDEADLFVPLTVTTDQEFSTLLTQVFPPYAKAGGVSAAVEARYPPVMSAGTNYSSEHDRVKALLGDSSFQCNVRYLSDAYKGKNYNLQYSVTPGLHALDLLPTFYNLNLDLSIFGNGVSVPLLPGFGSFAQGYQSYLVSHARSGNPNTYKKTLNIPFAITWPEPGNVGDSLTGVLDAGDFGFSLVTDGETKSSVCNFWVDVAAAVTELGGYAPPGSVVKTTLVPVTNDPSMNFA